MKSPSVNEAAWHAARLIPTSGINGAEEQERRATSALLAVISSVREYGRTLMQPLGAPASALECYIEVPFQLGERRLYPDGLIRARRGAKSWTALVEVKTSTNTLVPQQLEDYLDIAREHSFDALITISNEIPATPGTHPTPVDGRKLRKVALHHYSWSEILTAAVMQKEHRGVADSDQAWILGELIRYLEHPKSGAMSFEDMGEHWVSVREAVNAGTLRASDKGVAEVVTRFDALIRFAGLELGRQLGSEVMPVVSRAELAEPKSRVTRMVGELVKEGRLSADLRIPGTVSDMTVTADLRAGAVLCSFSVDAPREGKPTTRVNWLLRQLREAGDGIRVESIPQRASVGPTELLGKAREDAASLVPDSGREIKSFTVTVKAPMGSKRSAGRGGFIDSVLTCVNTSYSEVGQTLKGWAATPPKLRSVTVEVEDGIDDTLASTALSSQDED